MDAMDINSENGAKESILIVDDTPANLQVLAGMLKKRGFKARPVPSGKLALQAAQSDPPDLILLDITMPGMDGFEVCTHLKADEKLKDIPVIFVSALTETLDKVKAFSAGGVDYITKPFQFEEVQARVDIHLSLRRLQIELEKHNQNLQELVQNKVKEISNLQLSMIFAMARLSESRDNETGRHLDRVRTLCRVLAAELRESSHYRDRVSADYMDNIYNASPLHDIGKVGIPDSILLKPGKLTPEEFEIMKKHTIIGAETLGDVRAQYPKNAFLNMGIAIARSHHEKWDGNGYPDGLVGEDIPLSARIMAVADVYDALRSPRHYKPPMGHEKVCELIAKDSGTHFDPGVVDIFLRQRTVISELFDKMKD
jgi:putative two-component system response regulator